MTHFAQDRPSRPRPIWCSKMAYLWLMIASFIQTATALFITIFIADQPVPFIFIYANLAHVIIPIMACMVIGITYGYIRHSDTAPYSSLSALAVVYGTIVLALIISILVALLADPHTTEYPLHTLLTLAQFLTPVIMLTMLVHDYSGYRTTCRQRLRASSQTHATHPQSFSRYIQAQQKPCTQS